MLFVDLKFDNYFCVAVKDIAGLKFWFDLGEIKYYVFVVVLIGFGKLVFFIYFNYFISFDVFFKKLQRLKFLGVFIAFLVNEVYFYPDFNV
jgi:hypothetical protein